MYSESAVHRFWAQVDKSGECWIWTGFIKPDGHGHVNMDGTIRLVHRVAWELANGEIPAGNVVRHRCDNAPCVRDLHLLLGTQSDNVADMVERGRVAKGLGRPNSKLSPELVVAMRSQRMECGVSYHELARRFGVNYKLARAICIGERWQHVPGPVEAVDSPRSKKKWKWKSPITAEQIKQIYERRRAGERVIDLAREFGIDHVTVTNIAQRKYWPHLTSS